MEDEQQMLTELTALTASLPAPVKTAFFATVGRLLGGLTAFPEGWVRRRIQAYNDTTDARSAVAAILAKGVAENALADPVTMRAAAEIYLPNEIRKSRNKAQIAQIAAEQIIEIQKGDEAAAPPSDDWMNVFTRLAEDASSEDLQQLFARILAGEVTRPGSYSRATLRAVSELEKETAEDFAKMWSRGVVNEVDYSLDLQEGEWYLRWKRLAEAGLMTVDTSARILPSGGPSNGIYAAISTDTYALIIQVPEGMTLRWVHIPFTRVGRELGSVLPPPNLKENMSKVGHLLAKNHDAVVAILHGPGGAENLRP